VGSEFQVTIAATISHETIWILAVRRWVVGRQKTSAYLLRVVLRVRRRRTPRTNPSQIVHLVRALSRGRADSMIE
jgi:hypothetical protein